MSDWGLTFKIVGTGVVAIGVVLSIVMLAMWAIGRIFRGVSPEGEEQDRKQG